MNEEEEQEFITWLYDQLGSSDEGDFRQKVQQLGEDGIKEAHLNFKRAKVKTYMAGGKLDKVNALSSFMQKGGSLVKGSTKGVAEYQQMLKDKGYNVKVDGAWGSNTQKAFEQFTNNSTKENPSKPTQTNNFKYNTEFIERGRGLNQNLRTPESGVVVDKRKGKGYVIKDGKIEIIDVLTGLNPDGNVGSNQWPVESIDVKSRVTPVGYYKMDSREAVVGKENLKAYNNNVQFMQPIAAHGEGAPQAGNLAIHQTYDPMNRTKLFGTKTPYASYGCVNCKPNDMKNIMKKFPQGDTLMVADSNMPNYNRVIQDLELRAKKK